MDWFEDLPDKCPPEDAFVPNNETFYRFTKTYPPSDEDFYSHRKIWPRKIFRVSECQARSLSIQKELTSVNNLKKLPRFAKKKVVSVILDKKSGVIQKTGQDQSHYSWWRSTFFDINKSTELV